MKSMNDATCEIKSQALMDEFDEIMAFVRVSFQQARTAHEGQRPGSGDGC